MKQLYLLAAGVLTLGVCYLNAAKQNSSYTIAKYSLASIVALSEEDPSDVDASTDQDQSPAGKALKKGNTTQTDDVVEAQEDATNTDVDETDNEED